MAATGALLGLKHVNTMPSVAFTLGVDCWPKSGKSLMERRRNALAPRTCVQGGATLVAVKEVNDRLFQYHGANERPFRT